MISDSSQTSTLVNPIKNKSPSQHILSSGTIPLVLGKPKIITLTDEVHNK
jgi:hypothetical protein